MKFSYYLFALLLVAEVSYSQTYIYQHFGVDEGLPSSEVYDIYQDKQGYIWFATDKGLSRYNGYEFENFTTKDGLPGNTVLDFYPQKNGQVFCYEFHNQSLFYFDEVFDGFKNFEHNNKLKEQLESNTILKSIVLDNAGTLYAGGHNLAGFIEISKAGDIKKVFDKNTIRGKPRESFPFKLGFHKERGVFFLVYHDYKPNDKTIIFDLDENPSSRTDFKTLNENYSLFLDQKLGVISRNGIIEYYKTEQYPIGVKSIDNRLFFVGYYSNGAEIRDVNGIVYHTFLPNKSVSNFLIDAEGGYWFSTLEDGVFYIKNPDIKVYSNDHIKTLVKDNKGNLFAGYNNGNIAQIKKNNIELLYRGLNNNASLVEFDRKNNQLYGLSDGHLIDYSTGSQPIFIEANKLTELIANSLLASNSHNFFTKDREIIKKTGLTYKIKDVCSYNNSILIGTSSGLYLHKNDSVYKHQPNKLLEARIDDIDLNEKTNKIYMATQGNGVVVYGDSIYNINKKNGLSNNIVSEVHIENDSIIWACTNSGLNRIAFKLNDTFNITTITRVDGLLSNDINDVEIINDTVWVATKKGLCYFNKSVLDEKKTLNIQSLSLEDIRVNNETVFDKSIKLKYDQNNIEFKLQAISHKNTNNISYFYRLKEVDTTWAETKNRNISFPSLSPGSYTFEAKAKVFNNPNDFMATYTFKILPPFWRSWWFYSVCLVLLSALVYWFFKIRVFTYNRDITRELVRLAVKRLKRKELFYKFKSNGEEFKIPTHDILYINSQGNYLDIVTTKKTYTIRCKIGDFIATTPDVLEYLRIHRSYTIRIDQVTSKAKNWVVVKDQKIPVGETYLGELDKILF